MDARYLRVVNREKFQHYSDRCPPWIKLHRSIVTGEDKQLDDFLLLDEWEQYQLIRLWLLASQCEGFLLAFDERWVRRAIRTTKKVALEKFVRMGFLEVLSADEADQARDEWTASTGASTRASKHPPETAPDASALANARARRAGTEKTEVSEKDLTRGFSHLDQPRDKPPAEQVRALIDQSLKEAPAA